MVRIVSFLPAATEIIRGLGAQDMLCGVTDGCTLPGDAKNMPRIISPALDPGMAGAEIDRAAGAMLARGEEVFTLDEDALREAKPDLIIAQDTCMVCAAHGGHLDRALEILGDMPDVYRMDPHNIDEILGCVDDLARMLDVAERGRRLRESLEARIEGARWRGTGRRPDVLALEWLDPMFTSGHWVPQMIGIAGGHDAISRTGDRSRRMSLAEAAGADPDIIILLPCGFGARRAMAEYNATLAKNHTWEKMRAVRSGAVFAVDAGAYFSGPGISTVTGIEILARIIRPAECAGLQVPGGSYHTAG